MKKSSVIAAGLALGIVCTGCGSDNTDTPSEPTTVSTTAVPEEIEHEHHPDDLTAPNGLVETAATEYFIQSMSYKPADVQTPVDAQAKSLRYTAEGSPARKAVENLPKPEEVNGISQEWRTWQQEGSFLAGAAEVTDKTFTGDDTAEVVVKTRQTVMSLKGNVTPLDFRTYKVTMRKQNGIWLVWDIGLPNRPTNPN